MENRYFVTVELGSEKAAKWLKSEIEKMLSEMPLTDGIKVRIVKDEQTTLDKVIRRITKPVRQ